MPRITDEVLTEKTMFIVYDVIKATLVNAFEEAGVTTLIDPMAIDIRARHAIELMSSQGIVFRESHVTNESPTVFDTHNKYGIIEVHESHKLASRSDVGQLCSRCGTCVCHDKARRLVLPCTGKME